MKKALSLLWMCFFKKTQARDVASLKNFVSGIAFLDGVWYYITRLIEVMR